MGVREDSSEMKPERKEREREREHENENENEQLALRLSVLSSMAVLCPAHI